MSMKQVNLMHMFLVGPLLLYIGNKKEKTENWAFYSLATLTFMLPFIVRLPIYDSINYRSIVNSTHYVIWIPLFLYISYKKKDLEPYWWQIISLLGVSVFTIHLFLLLQKIDII